MRTTGVVKWFDVRHGCGLIRRPDGETDCMIRQSGMRGTALRVLAAGDPVAFDVVQDPRGPTARNLVRLTARQPCLGPDVERHATS